MALSEAFFLGFLMVFNTFIVQVRAADTDTETWSYQAVDRWPTVCLTGRRQSPIAIQSYDAMYDPSLIAFRQYNFNFNLNGTLQNPGNRGVKWTVDNIEDETKLSKISGGGLVGEYFIRSLEFRWALSDCDGSDHYIDYKPVPLEVELLAYRSVKSTSDIDFTADTIAAFSYLFQVGNTENAAWNPIFQAIERVQAPGMPTNLNITLNLILPSLQQTAQYYRYNGSLTTPPCTESVAWTIFSSKQTISDRQMKILKRVQSAGGSGGAVQVAYRPLQQIGIRRVVTNVRTQTGVAAPGSVAAAGQKSAESVAPASLHLDAALAMAALFAAILFAN